MERPCGRGGGSDGGPDDTPRVPGDGPTEAGGYFSGAAAIAWAIAVSQITTVW